MLLESLNFFPLMISPLKENSNPVFFISPPFLVEEAKPDTPGNGKSFTNKSDIFFTYTSPLKFNLLPQNPISIPALNCVEISHFRSGLLKVSGASAATAVFPKA